MKRMNGVLSRNRRFRQFAMLASIAILLVPFIISPAHGADVFNGQQVYSRHCQVCHGADGRAMVPGSPDFSRGEALFRLDSELYRLIREGRSAMPAYRGILTEDETRDVIAYLRTLQR